MVRIERISWTLGKVKDVKPPIIAESLNDVIKKTNEIIDMVNKLTKDMETKQENDMVGRKETDMKKLAKLYENTFAEFLIKNHPVLAKEFKKFKIVFEDDEPSASKRSSK